MGTLSAIEAIKRDSDGLRGRLRDSLADPVTGALHDDDTQVLKFHGGYQQDDRDLREERRLAKLEPAYTFMIRLRAPGGVLTPAQWLALDAIARTYAERGLRITTRQTLQLHGVIKRELKATLQAIDAALLDTIAACGDVNRNVVVAVNPRQSFLHAQVYAQAAALSENLLPRTHAYHEIWLDKERVAGSENDPLYGQAYLPRKFKIGFAIPPRNDIDVFAQDLGFVAIVEERRLRGYDVCAGGGMGMTHGDPKTYPRVAEVIGFVEPRQVQALARAVIETQRDFGDRGERKHARLKYTLADRGIAWFKSELERRAGFALQAARGFEFIERGDAFGWSESEDGHMQLCLRIPAGRVRDDGRAAYQTGLRELASLLQACAPEAQFRLTPNQNVMVAGVPPSLRAEIDAILAKHRLDLHGRTTPLHLNALACVALPTCGLAMAEAERYLPRLLDALHALLEKHGLREAPFDLRISGCPNGCSRPYLAEIALIGKAPGRYNLMLGGDHRGQRMNALYRENIAESDILAALDPLLARYAGEREPDERFGDFLQRTGLLEHGCTDAKVSL
ncbi:MAG TPA: assimilatory sulfite reductase (NADPH) hemoprotein subunit [Rhodanobacteraceae bacterium]|nr:assimilatory sulfite reductase (NADPH) hemoprotein subunit [Rhodanobacteraceae bacterium]